MKASAERSQVPLRKRPHAVYWLYGPGDLLLYIGVTNNIYARLAVHRSNSKDTWWPWVVRYEVRWFDRYIDAIELETRELRAIRPLCNPVIPEANGRHITIPDGRTAARSTWALVSEAAEADGTTIEAVLNEALRRYLKAKKGA